MGKINRFNGNVAAIASENQAGERYVFGTESTESDDLTAQFTTDLLRGWGVIGASEFPPLEWFNAVSFTATQFIAYLHQMGVPEWNAAQEYHTDSIATYSGQIYISLTGDNTGNQPDLDIVNWKVAAPELDIAGLDEKTTLADADQFLIADSEDSDNKKRVSKATLQSELSTELPSITGSATFTNSTQVINLTGVGDLDGLDIGDVLQIQNSTSNNTEFTVESITDSDNVVVNYEHRGKTTSKALVDEISTAGVTIKLLCKGYNAPVGLGQGWVDVLTSRSSAVEYVTQQNRSMQISIAINPSSTAAYVESGGTEAAIMHDPNNTVTVRQGAEPVIPVNDTYELTSSGDGIFLWAELR